MSTVGEVRLDSHDQVIWALLTYTDWWQPSSTSILQVAAARRSSDLPNGFRDGLLDTLDERTELCRRMARLGDRDRRVLYLWYVQQLSATDIAKALHISRRQCFRLRAGAIHALVKQAEQAEETAPTSDAA
jgi:DNA-directed RNA polymerase specialized sigma subunit